MRDKTGWIAWDRRHLGGLRVIGFVSSSAGLAAALAFAMAMELDLGPRMSVVAEAWAALGVFGLVGGLAAMVTWMLTRVRAVPRAEAASFGTIASKTTANTAVSATANVMAGESSSEFEMEGFRAPSRVMTIDQALAKASLAWREGKHAKAEGLVKSAIAELEGAWPSGSSASKDNGHERRLASALATLASFCVEQGKDIEAEPLFRRFLELGDRVFGPDHPKVAQAMISLEGLYKRIGATDLSDSIRARRELLRSQNVVSSEARAMLSRAGALFLQGKYAEANTLAKQALDLGEKEQSETQGNSGIDQYLTLLGRIQCALGDLDSAEGHFLHALASVDKTKERDTAERGTVLWNLGQVYRRQGRYLPAEPLLNTALAIREEAGGPNSPETAECLSELALLHAAKREWTKADPYRKRAIAAWETAIRSRPRPAAVGPRYAGFLESFVTILRRNDRDAEADALAVRARAVRSGIC